VNEETSAEEELRRLQEENRRLTEKCLYLQAEVENTRKLAEKEVERKRRAVSERIMKQVIVVYEDVKRAVESLRDTDPPTLAEGLKLILRQLEGLLAAEAVERIDVVGKKFDPFIHEAVEFEETDDVEDGTVIAEVEPGFSMEGRVIRTPKVKVGRKRGGA